MENYSIKMKAGKMARLLNEGWTMLEIACLAEGVKKIAIDEKKLIEVKNS